jgi:tRNA A58 N-methylase Trm61
VIRESKISVLMGKFLGTSVFSLLQQLMLKVIPKIIKLVHVNGFLMYIRPYLLSDLIISLPNYEPDIQKVFKPKPGEIVIDVGAHIGYYTLKAARAVGTKGKVIAIEPNPENFHLLRNNVILNRFYNVMTLPIAIGARALV